MWSKLGSRVLGHSAMPSFEQIGILGAGRAGTAFARAAARKDIAVQIASTRTPTQMRYHLMQYAPQAHAVLADDIATGVDLIILAVPQEDLGEVEPGWLADRIVIDATNRWDDEPLPAWFEAGLATGLSSSEVIAQRFNNATIVKALNHISHWAMDAPATSEDRAAVVASDDSDAAEFVARFVAALGYTPVVAPNLADGRAMEPGSPFFNVAATAQQLSHHVLG